MLNAITEVRRPEIRRSKTWKHHTAVTLLPVWLCSPVENGISHHTKEDLKAIYIERRKKPEEGHVPRKWKRSIKILREELTDGSNHGKIISLLLFVYLCKDKVFLFNKYCWNKVRYISKHLYKYRGPLYSGVLRFFIKNKITEIENKATQESVVEAEPVGPWN